MDQTRHMLELAREDYRVQEAYRNALFDRLKFVLTATTLLIAADISLTSVSRADWRWWVQACFTVAIWAYIIRMFSRVWSAYYGHDYAEPKPLTVYVNWENGRRVELEEAGLAEAETVAHVEMLSALSTAYAEASERNREVNLLVQAGVTAASRLLLYATLLLLLESIFFVITLIMT